MPPQEKRGRPQDSYREEKGSTRWDFKKVKTWTAQEKVLYKKRFTEMDFKMVLFSANKNEFVFIFLFLENKNIVMSHE